MAEIDFILERLTCVAPLGLCFWDPVTQSMVSDGLQVTAIPKVSDTYLGQPVSAHPNRSGVFIFHHLPGLKDVEAGRGDRDYWDNLPSPKEYIVTVEDIYEHFPSSQSVKDMYDRFLPSQPQRFLPFQITINAPHKGIYSWEITSSHPLLPMPGQPAGTIPLYSAPQRPGIPGLAVLHADLITEPEQPAAWAVLEAYHQDELLGRGLADKEGHAVLFFPYPRLAELSPYQNRPPLTQETWQIDLEVFFSPDSSIPDRPDLCALMEQAPARLLETLSPASTLSQIVLTFGQEIILKTLTKSELWIDALPASPP